MEYCELAIDVGQRNMGDIQAIEKVHKRLQSAFRKLQAQLGDNIEQIQM